MDLHAVTVIVRWMRRKQLLKKLGESRALRFSVIGAPVIVMVQGFVYGDDLLGLFLNGLLNFDLGVKRAKPV